MGIKENLRKAIGIIGAHEDRLINLGHYQTITKCGTFNCSAGLLATHPFFIEQGMRLAYMDTEVWMVVKNGIDIYNHPRLYVDGKMVELKTNTLWIDDMFGEDAFCRLFCTRGASRFDVDDGGLSDKEVALNRLHCQLRMVEEDMVDDQFSLPSIDSIVLYLQDREYNEFTAH